MITKMNRTQIKMLNKRKMAKYISKVIEIKRRERILKLHILTDLILLAN